MMDTILTNEWTLAEVIMPPIGREVLTKVERPTRRGNIEIRYGGVMIWTGYYWIDANEKTRVRDIVYKWYMFERDTKETQEY